jgi:hypothetical protein
MEFLLPKEQLKGLSPEEQKAVKDDALNQFLLGSIFGGGGIATGYQAVQNIIPNLQKTKQQQGLLQELGSIQQEFFPTPAQAGQRALVNQPTRTSTDFGPSPEAALRQQQILNQPIDFNAAYSRLGRLATNPNAAAVLPSLTSALQNLQPKVQGDLVLNPNQQIIRGLPTQKEGITSQFNPLTGGFSAAPVQNYLQSKVATTLPEVPVGAQLSFNDAGILQTNLLPNMRTVQQQIAFDKQFGQGQAQLQTTPTNVINPVSGRTTRTTEAAAMGQPTALSASEVQAFEGYKPVREAAFKGFQAATSSDASLQNLQNIINRGAFEPGKFAGFKSEAAAIATGLGIGGDRAKAVAVDSPLFLQSVADVASANIQDLVGATSDKDIQFSASRGPQITNPKEAVQYYLDLTRVANQRKKDYYNYVTKNPVPNVVEQWSQTPQGSSSIFEDPKLRKYLPSFPVTAGPDKGKTAYQLPSGIFRVYN